MMFKRGQGLSLNVIVLAALALIVLVVLVVVFTGRTALFASGVSKEGNAELVSLKVTYGDCHPTTATEGTFRIGYDSATSNDLREQAKDTLRQDISRCKEFSDKDACESRDCKWS